MTSPLQGLGDSVLQTKIQLHRSKFFDENGVGKDYNFTFNNILDILGDIQIGLAEVRGVKIRQLKPLSDVQNDILNYLNVELKINKDVEVVH